jgi:hypothetical protein
VSRARLIIAAALVVVFVAAGAYIVFGMNHHAPQNRTFDLTVTGASKMQPDSISANVGDMLTINVHSDTTGEVHLHDYDIAFNATAGQVVSHTFKADKTCSCEIEWESTSTHLGTLTVNP